MMNNLSNEIDLPPAYECHRSDSILIPASSATRPVPPGPLLLPTGEDQLPDPYPKPPGPDEALPPPEYARQDPDVRSFSLQVPFISFAPLMPAAPSSCIYTPRFQLSQMRSSLGKPYKLSMRRLTTTESRRASLALSTSSTSSSSRGGPSQERIDFDDDFTVYEASNTNALHRFTTAANVQIRGCKARTLRGHIELSDLSKHSGTCRFWHLTRRQDAGSEMAQAKMQRWGYKPEEEWNKRLLFAVQAESSKSRTRPWKDGKGKVVAFECGSDLDFVGEIDLRDKEALLACWASRLWVLNQLEWLADG